MRLGWGVLTLRVLDALEQYGPLTAQEVCVHLGLARRPGGSIFGRLRASTPKQVHIVAWQRDQEGQRQYLRAVYAAGPGPDAPKPAAIHHRDSLRRSRQAAQAAMSSIVPGISQRDASRMRARLPK